MVNWQFGNWIQLPRLVQALSNQCEHQDSFKRFVYAAPVLAVVSSFIAYRFCSTSIGAFGRLSPLLR